jgi:hypothetical protein
LFTVLIKNRLSYQRVRMAPHLQTSMSSLIAIAGTGKAIRCGWKKHIEEIQKRCRACRRRSATITHANCLLAGRTGPETSACSDGEDQVRVSPCHRLHQSISPPQMAILCTDELCKTTAIPYRSKSRHSLECTAALPAIATRLTPRWV